MTSDRPTTTEHESETSTTRPQHVRTLYRVGQARWYDPFRKIWVRLTAQGAEAEFDRHLRDTVQTGCRVLDIGCGTGYNLGRLIRLGLPFVSYRGVDLTDSMLTIAGERYASESRASFEQADLHTLANTPERFDLILCTWVVSHLERPRDAVEIATQLLAPSGQAMFLAMTEPRWYVSAWFSPLARLFQARCVKTSVFRGLPATTLISSSAAGLVTLARLQRAADDVAGRAADAREPHLDPDPPHHRTPGGNILTVAPIPSDPPTPRTPNQN